VHDQLESLRNLQAHLWAVADGREDPIEGLDPPDRVAAGLKADSMESDIADLERCRFDPVEYRAALRRRIGDEAYSRGQASVSALVRLLRGSRVPHRETRPTPRRLRTVSRQRRSRRVTCRRSSRAGPKSDSDPSPPSSTLAAGAVP